MAFMADYFGFAREMRSETRRKKFKIERRGFDQFCHNSCRSAMAGEVCFFGFAMARRKSKQLVRRRTAGVFAGALTRAIQEG